jgi:hypothetical protein
VRVRNRRVDAQRGFRLRHPLLDIRRVVVIAHEDEAVGEARLREREPRVERDRPAQQIDGGEVLRAIGR